MRRDGSTEDTSRRTLVMFTDFKAPAFITARSKLSAPCLKASAFMLRHSFIAFCGLLVRANSAFSQAAVCGPTSLAQSVAPCTVSLACAW